MEEKFEEKMKQTDESEKLQQESKDSKLLDDIRRGDQVIFIRGIGDVIFRWPSLEMNTEADRIYAEIYSSGLGNGKIKTKAQLEAIYARPTTIKENGVDVPVDSGVWSSKDTDRLKDIPREIQSISSDFGEFREEIQQIENEIGALDTHSKSKKAELQKKRTNLWERALELFGQIEKLNREYLDLNSKYLQLFSSCLEEQANLEKLKYLAPQCLFKKDKDEKETLLWQSKEEFLTSRNESLYIFSVFSLFMRGSTIETFGESPEIAKNLVRYRYCKEFNIPYFSGEQLNDVQLALYNWFEYYVWITGPEGPSDKPDNWEYIVDNDFLLDEFIDNWKASFKKEKKKEVGALTLDRFLRDLENFNF